MHEANPPYKLNKKNLKTKNWKLKLLLQGGN
jgi:hypothetical protein